MARKSERVLLRLAPKVKQAVDMLADELGEDVTTTARLALLVGLARIRAMRSSDLEEWEVYHRLVKTQQDTGQN